MLCSTLHSSKCLITTKNVTYTGWQPFSSRMRAGRRPGMRAGRGQLHVRALGFDFDDEQRPAAAAKLTPKAFGAFAMRASSLLVYQHVFKGAVGEALLSLLAMSQKYQASNKDIIGAYTKFYNLLMLSGYDDWSDYMIDQILLGRDNPFARAAAQGQVQPGAPILQAVAYDLDTLQGLCVSLSTLAEFVGEVAPTAGSYWISAASATSVKRSSSSSSSGSSGGSGKGDKQQSTGAPLQVAVALPGSSSGTETGAGVNSSSSAIGRPASAEELSQWRAAFSSHDSWSAALPLLQQYYLQHGFGITSRNSALRWSKGGFEEASEGALAQILSGDASPSTSLAPPMAAGMPQPVLSALQGAYSELSENTRRHCAGLPAQHAVVCGPPGSAKSWLLWEGTLLAGQDAGLRLVDVPGSELSNLLEIARGCARYPRVRFILVADHVSLPLQGAAAGDVVAALSGSGPSAWPANTLLYVGATAASTVSRADPLVARCTLVLPVQGLQAEQDYVQAVSELLSAAGKSLSESDRAAAVDYGKQHGWSVRSAATFVRTSC